VHRSVSRSQMLLLVVFAALLITTGWSYSQMAAARSAAWTAAQDSQECRRLADQIKQLRDRPTRASLEAHSATELARLVEQAAKAASLPAQSLVQIDPQAARRVGETTYREQPTHVELRDVTLGQLITFLYMLSQDDMGMDVADLRLRAPRDDKSARSAEETWLAEVTLTHLIFAP